MGEEEGEEKEEEEENDDNEGCGDSGRHQPAREDSETALRLGAAAPGLDLLSESESESVGVRVAGAVMTGPSKDCMLRRSLPFWQPPCGLQCRAMLRLFPAPSAERIGRFPKAIEYHKEHLVIEYHKVHLAWQRRWATGRGRTRRTGTSGARISRWSPATGADQAPGPRSHSSASACLNDRVREAAKWLQAAFCGGRPRLSICKTAPGAPHRC
jgi:hypothetical protein